MTTSCVPWWDVSNVADLFAQNYGPYLYEQLTEPSLLFGSDENLQYSEKGLSLSIFTRGDSPHIQTPLYIYYGKVGVDIRRAIGQGIVSAFYLISDDLDEIDLELLGGDMAQAQTNFFVKGNVSNYDRGMSHTINPEPQFHRYEIEWTPHHIRWYIDQSLHREVPHTSPHGFPTSPVNIHFSLWAGGDSELSPWTTQWAGGYTNYDEVPFTMTVRNLVVQDYSAEITYSYNCVNGSWNTPSADASEVAAVVPQLCSSVEDLGTADKTGSSAPGTMVEILEVTTPCSTSAAATAAIRYKSSATKPRAFLWY